MVPTDLTSLGGQTQDPWMYPTGFHCGDPWDLAKLVSENPPEISPKQHKKWSGFSNM